MTTAPSLWHLAVFRAVIEAASVTHAAAGLGLTQPAASQALKKLEQVFGALLVERRSGAIAPTEAGAILLSRAAVALNLLAEGLNEALGARKNATQLLRVTSSRRLEILVSIVRNGGFADAARAEGYAAPTIHRAAKDLEHALGVSMFEATSYGVRPTRQAEALARKAGLAFAELRQAQAEIADLRGRDDGHTAIGAMPLARAHLIPAAVAAFCERRPEHKVSIVEGSYEDLLIALRRGEVDLLVGALRGHVVNRDIEESPLFDDLLAVVMRAGHPLATRRQPTGAELAAYPWVVPRATSPLRGHFDALFRDLKTPPPNDVIECNSLGASRVLLMNSNRLMLLSDEQIRYEKAAGMLISKRHPCGRVARAIGLTKRCNWRPTRAQEALVSEILAQARKIEALKGSQIRHPACLN